MNIKNSALSVANGMFWFGVLCLLTSLIGLTACGIFFVGKVTPATAIQQFQNTRQAAVGFAGMSAGVSFTMVCLARSLKKILRSLPEA